MAVLDVEETNPDSETQSRLQRTVGAFPAELPGLPNFSLRPRKIHSRFMISLFRRLAPRVSTKGAQLATVIDLSQEVEQDGAGTGRDDSFSGQYLLAGDLAAVSPQVEQLRQVFMHDVRTFLADEPGWYVNVYQGHMVAWRGDSWCRPDELASFLERAVALFRLFTTKAGQA